MNTIILIGNLTRDPELRTTQAGISVCSFAIAVGRRQANAQGERETDYFNVSAWRQLGENCAKYLTKGKKCMVKGALQIRQYKAKDGTDRTAVEVNADEIEFLSPRVEPTHPPDAEGFTEIPDDELPF